MSIIGFCGALLVAQAACAPNAPVAAVPVSGPQSEQELLALSRTKWRLMAEQNVDSLTALFADQAVFVHMGGTMSRQQELDVIKGGMIKYKKADVEAASVRFTGNTGIVLNTITLLAEVGGNEVTNHFEVTEVYVPVGGVWKLASLSFTRLLR